MWYLVLGSFALVFFVFALAKVTEVQALKKRLTELEAAPKSLPPGSPTNDPPPSSSRPVIKRGISLSDDPYARQGRVRVR